MINTHKESGLAVRQSLYVRWTSAMPYNIIMYKLTNGGGRNCLRRCLRRIRWGDMWQSVDHTMTIYDWLSGAKLRKKHKVIQQKTRKIVQNLPKCIILTHFEHNFSVFGVHFNYCKQQKGCCRIIIGEANCLSYLE